MNPSVLKTWIQVPGDIRTQKIFGNKSLMVICLNFYDVKHAFFPSKSRFYPGYYVNLKCYEKKGYESFTNSGCI